MSLIGPSGNTGVFIAPDEALYLYARTGNLILQSSNVFLSGLLGGNVVTLGSGGRILASGTTASELGFLSGVTSSVQGQINSKFNASGHSASRVVVTSGTGVATMSTITTTELGYLSGLSNNIQQQLNNVQSTLVLNPNIVPVTNATGNLVSSTVTNVEVGYLSGLRSGIQSQIDGKQNTINFPSGTNRVIVTDGAGNVTTSSVTTTDLGQLSGVTSGIQSQLDSKLNVSGHPGDRIVATSGSGIVTTINIATANMIALDSLRSIASNVTGNLIVSGSVGILKNNPNVALDVAGAISASSMAVGNLNSAATVSGTLSTDSLVASTVTVSSQLRPSTHNTVDIGTNSTRFRDLYVQGTIYAPSTVTTASATSNVIVADNSSLATPQYLLHVPGTSGEQPSRVTSSRLSFVPQTGNLSATNFIGNLVGIAANATRWTNARTVSLTGPVTGSVTLDGTQNVSIATSVANDAVALGTHTTGNYVATIGAGSGGITVSGSGTENAAVTISSNATSTNTVGAIVSRDAGGNFSANTITANITGIAANATRWTNARTVSLTGPVTGTVTIDGTQNVSIATSVANDAVALGTNTTGNYVATIGAGSGGITVSGSGAENAAVTISSNATSTNTVGAIVSRDVGGNFSANTIAANITGIAANATRWTNARTVSLTGPVTGTVTLDGTQNVSIATALSATAVALGTNTTGSYISNISGTNGLTAIFTGSSVVVSSNATSTNTIGSIVSRDAAGNFSANTVTANIDGIATTATRLQTTRFINGQPFDGTGNVTIPSAVLATLTPGTYISGTAYDGTTARTWTLNASTGATGGTVVARDSNGDFSARTIAANLTGEATVAARVRNLLRPGTGFAVGTSNYDGQADVTWNIGILGTDNFPNIAGLNAGGYGASTTCVSVTVDNKGRITTISNASISSASTTQIGLVQLNDTVTSTSTSIAATANAAKTANDNANVRLAKSGDTVTGNLSTSSTGWFAGNGWALTSLNATNVTLGTLQVTRIPQLNASQIPALDASFISTGTLQVTRIPQLNASQIPALDASFISTGTLGVARGGTGQVTLAQNKILVGNGTSGILSPTDLHWTGTNLGIGKINPATLLDVAGTVTATGGVFTGSVTVDGSVQSSLGYRVGDLEVIDASGNFVAGGLRLTSSSGDPALIVTSAGNVGIGTTSPNEALEVNGFVRSSLGYKVGPTQVINSSGNISSAAFVPALDASFVSTGTLGVARGGTGQTTLSANKLLVGNATSSILQPTNLHWDNSNSRIGIGTTIPYTRVHVGATPLSNPIFDTNALSVWHSTAVSTTALNDPVSLMYIGRPGTLNQSHATGASFAICRWENSGDSSRARMDVRLAHGQWATGDSDMTTVMSMRSDNRIGIGTTVPSYELHVIGNIAASSDIIAFASDERLKINVRSIEHPLDKIDKLSGVHFDWIPEVRALGFCPPRMTDEVGLLAQQVQSVVPQAVAHAPFDREGDKSKSGQDYLTIKYDKLVPLLLEGIKELRKEVEDLKKFIRDHGI